ncbi:MAG: siderophore-interacting protein [Actinomycetia bacterium]|nr:siderophore-interacting protein [Actinomycetes bacterium]
MTSLRQRREPPAFRLLEVKRTEVVSPYMQRVILGGSALEGFMLDGPAASIRVLLPTQGELAIPVWAGNEFLNRDGSRPIIRTLTPRRLVAQMQELHVDVVLHEEGVASSWARSAQSGSPVAISGPGRAYTIDPDADAFVLVGDESAIPAICQLLEYLPTVPITVHIAARHDDAVVDLHRDVAKTWHVTSDRSTADEQLIAAISRIDLGSHMRFWAAGEAATMQRIRKYLFAERSFPRSQAVVRGYWKRDR